MASTSWGVLRIEPELLEHRVHVAVRLEGLSLGAALSGARRNSEKIAIFLRHLCAVRFAEDQFHPFHQSIWKLLSRFSCSAVLLYDGRLSHPRGYLQIADL